ncbi:hypothetical protein JYT16_01105 [Gemmatimonas aurantiaca]|nr:hypothetical protein [Gemmatimonas aurantiaca]
MKTKKLNSIARKSSLAFILVIAMSVGAQAIAPPLPKNPLDTAGPQPGPAVLPTLVRQVIHDQGNINTTVDNWGLIGGYSFISAEVYPSGEWPRGSNHSYIAEVKYWMGAVTAAGDTVVANTADDFQPIPTLRASADAYNIFLSTDSLSYDYDAADTVGFGVGSAAKGWRVWNNDSAAWLYNQVYSPSDSIFVPGGPVAVQESHYRFNDAARGAPALGLELTQTVYQWNYCYNEDFLFVVVDIINNSTEDYMDFAFGLYCDFDIGGNDPSTGENGRLSDVVDYDTANGLAWTLDVNGYDNGWGAKTGVMGTKYIETPNNLGMSAFRTGLWDNLPLDPDKDAERYALISAQVFDTPLAPEDQYYLQCTNGFNFLAGSSIRVVYAIIAGEDETAFRSSADLAQSLYDNYFVGPEPPATPTLSARPAEGRVYLSWDNVAEVSVDPLSGTQDFLGYRIYRSANLGGSWGEENKDASGGSCSSVDWDPIVTFKVSSAGDPAPHSYIDTNVINGVEYWYCIAAYDAGDTSVGVDQLQSSFGTPTSDRNVIVAYPDNHPAGYYSALSTISRNQISDSSDGTIWPITLDPYLAGSNIHKIVFYENDTTTYWAVVDTVTGDTVLSDQTLQFAYQELIADSLMSFYPIVNGMQIAVFNGERTPGPMLQTGFAGTDTTLLVRTFYGATNEVFGVPQQYWGSDLHFRSTYEVRFTVDGSTGADLWDGVTPMTMPFEVWNVTTNQRLHVEVYDFAANGVYDADQGDIIAIVNLPYDGGVHPEAYPLYHVWMFNLNLAAAANAQPGDVFTVIGAPLNGPSDEFYFAPDGINSSLATSELADIKVAPNPYFARAENWENNTTPNRLQFINLPNRCTIRVYTLAGDLVRTIEHDSDGGDEAWNLLSEGGRQIASGIYFYHIDSDYGEHLGRFAVIK